MISQPSQPFHILLLNPTLLAALQRLSMERHSGITKRLGCPRDLLTSLMCGFLCPACRGQCNYAQLFTVSKPTLLNYVAVPVQVEVMSEV